MGILNSEKVISIFNDCVCEKFSQDAVEYTSIKTVSLNSQKLKEHETEIYTMLKELPEEFMVEGGGGYSFLMACNDKHGNQWTGLHSVMEQLFLLGLGINKVQCLMPREFWRVLPGGMPYYVVS